jgi:hypothetical protein
MSLIEWHWCSWFDCGCLLFWLGKVEYLIGVEEEALVVTVWDSFTGFVCSNLIAWEFFANALFLVEEFFF